MKGAWFTEKGKTVFVNAMQVCCVVPYFEGSQIYLSGKAEPLTVEEDVDDVVNTLDDAPIGGAS